VDALLKTKLPLIVMDTTPAFSFAPGQSPDEIMYNHGIHGVQDMCNLLVRNNRHFVIEAGHMDHSDIINRITRHVRSAKMAMAMRNARTGLIGRPFEGMGDFAVDPATLKETTGAAIIRANTTDIGKYMPDESDPSVERELEADAARFDTKETDPGLHRLSVRNGIALREWIKEQQLTAFTLNFSEITQNSGLSVMPFLEISKLLAGGTGYAGEGDVLTASFIGALFAGFREVTFTEMFCPDWEHNAVFLSHMGEMNVELTAGKPRLINMEWKFTSAPAPVLAAGCYKEGRALFANLAPTDEHAWSLILAPVTMLPESSDTRFAHNIRGWMRPDIPLADFLEAFSRLGGTHHSALIYTEEKDIIKIFGEMMGWDVHMLE
jgi:L-arabinose isomerase